MKQLTIQEWFARAVAAGLMPDDEDISGRIVFTEGKRTIMLFNESKEIYRVEELWNSNSTVIGNDTQLRKDGKDLFGLEWRKPTEGDVGKMCWLSTTDAYDRKIVMCITLTEEDLYSEFSYQTLIADHGQISPTEQNFKRIYGEQ